MVSFQCDGCADTVKKPQLDKHRQRCWAPFTCLDCSTTFHNTDYKSHTSCITEAEKYQGSLYRGPRKGNSAPSASSTPAFTPSETPADSPAPESGIHPSRLNQMQGGAPDRGDRFAPRGRGGFARGRGRGGFGNFGGAGHDYVKKSVTGENRTAPEGGMRTWGSAPVSDAEEEGPKKKRKGDKGGTGAKANSRIKHEGEAEGEAPSKKRKFDSDDTPATSTSTPAPAPSGPPSDKTLKRIKKHMGKLESKADGLSLSDWLEKVAQGKEKRVETDDVLRGVKVAFKDGAWQLSI